MSFIEESQGDFISKLPVNKQPVTCFEPSDEIRDAIRHSTAAFYTDPVSDILPPLLPLSWSHQAHIKGNLLTC